METTFEEVKTSIEIRDKNDKEKEVGALKLAPDSIIVDTTGKTIEEVVAEIIEIIKQKK